MVSMPGCHNRNLLGIFSVDGGSLEGGVVFDDGDWEVFREWRRFVWWMEVLWGQSWGRGRIFIASPSVWDDREVMGQIAYFISYRRFRGEELVCIGGVRWWDMAEKDISSWEVVEQECFQAEKVFFGLRAVF